MNITLLQRLSRCVAIGLSLLLVLPAHAETIAYQHDNNGNITQRGTTTYIYDALNRLVSESGPAKTQNFTYDANGNRLSDGAGVYTYAPTSNRMLTRRGLPVTLDAAGNITGDGTGRTYVYNQAGQIAQVKQSGILIASYYYNYRGLRTRKVTTASAPQGAQTTLYVYDQWGKIIAEVSGSGTPLRTYIWRDNTPVAQIEHQPSRKIFYFTVDHLNTPRSMMDETGKIVWRWESDAFGSTLPNEDVDGDGVKITSNLRFPGQYYDKETGLHYNWHRYYDPTMGQYIQADPVGLAAGINLYAYVGGNPPTRVDTMGLDWFRPVDHPYVVGRKDSIVEPGKGVGKFIDDHVPAGHTFGSLHDAAVDVYLKEGYPDWLVNIPTMPSYYWEAIVNETTDSILNLFGKKPRGDSCQK